MQQMRDERGKIQCNANHDKLQQARQHVPGQFTEPADHRLSLSLSLSLSLYGELALSIS